MNHFASIQRRIWLLFCHRSLSQNRILVIFYSRSTIPLLRKWWCTTSAPYRQTTVRTESTTWKKSTTLTLVKTTVSILEIIFFSILIFFLENMVELCFSEILTMLLSLRLLKKMANQSEWHSFFVIFFRSLSIIIISRLMIDKKRTCNTFCEIIKKLFEFHRVPCKTQVLFVIVWRFCLMGSWPISFNIVSRTTLRVFHHFCPIDDL